jgi:hypothetical protein
VNNERQGEHPARAYGVTGGGFAEGQAKPEEFEEDKEVGAFATGEEDLERFPEDAQLGSFARGQESQQNTQEGTFGEAEAPAEE